VGVPFAPDDAAYRHDTSALLFDHWEGVGMAIPHDNERNDALPFGPELIKTTA
jgi:hypothetical protein